MIEAVFSGILAGLVIAILIGPVFFTLLNSSLQKGFRAGLFVAFGICFSDLVYLLVADFGLSELINNDTFKTILGYVGGGLMMIVGIAAFVLKPPTKGQDDELPPNADMKHLMKGFLINFLNPFVLLFWISSVGLASLNEKFTREDKFIYFTTILLTILSTDILKAYTATKISGLLKPGLITRVHKISGIVLIIFSFRLFYFAFFGV